MLAAIVALYVLPCTGSNALAPASAHVVGGAYQTPAVAPRADGNVWVYTFDLKPGYYETKIDDGQCAQLVRFAAIAADRHEVPIVLGKNPDRGEFGAVAGTIPIPGLDMRISGESKAVAPGLDAIQRGRYYYFDQLPPGDYRLLFKFTPCCTGWMQQVHVSAGHITRVDGNAATYFSQASASTDKEATIEQILPMRDGSLWLAEYLGWAERLAHWRPHSYSEFTVPLPRPVLRSLNESPAGITTASSQYTQMILLDRRGNMHVFAPNGALHGPMVEVFADPSGGWWLVPEDRAAQLQHVNARGILDWHSSSTYVFNRAAASEDGSLWATAPDLKGLLHVTKSRSVTLYGQGPKNPAVVLWDVGIAPDGTPWFCGGHGEIGQLKNSLLVVVGNTANGERCWLKTGPANSSIWAVQYNDREIQLLDPQGSLRTFETDAPLDSAVGTDDGLWTEQSDADVIVHYLPNGEVRRYHAPLEKGLGVKPLARSKWDGSIWFVERGGTVLGRIHNSRVSELPLKISPMQPLEARGSTSEPQLSKGETGNVLLTVASCMGGFGGPPALRMNRQDIPPSWHRFEDLGLGPSRPMEFHPRTLAPGLDRFTFSLSPGVYELYAENRWCFGQVMLTVPASGGRSAVIGMSQFGGFNRLFDHDHVAITGLLPLPGLRINLHFPNDPAYVNLVRVRGRHFFGDSIQRALWSMNICDAVRCGRAKPVDLRRTRPGSLITLSITEADLRNMFSR